MKLFTKAILVIFCLSTAYVSYGEELHYSFDRLYPETALSNTLRSLKQVWATACSYHEDRCKGIKSQLAASGEASGVDVDPKEVCQQWLTLHSCLKELSETRMRGQSLDHDLVSYMSEVWQLIGQAYELIHAEDESLKGFLAQMHVTCGMLIKQLE